MEIQDRNDVADFEELLQVFSIGPGRDWDEYSKTDSAECEIGVFKVGGVASRPHSYGISNDTEMDFRPISFADWAFVLVAGAAGGGGAGEGEDAWRSCAFCAEESGA